MAYAEANYAALGLAAYGARLPDAAWLRADLSLRPISNSRRTRRWLRLQAAFGSLRPLALTAQLFHAGSNGSEVVSSAGPVHVCSSLPLDLVLTAAQEPAAEPRLIEANMANIYGQVPALPHEGRAAT